MRQQTAIAPVTDAVATTVLVDASNHEWVTVCADNLADAEEVDIYVKAGGTFVLAPNRALDGPAKLTATITALRLEGGLEYGVRKDATAGACGVYFNIGRTIER